MSSQVAKIAIRSSLSSMEEGEYKTGHPEVQVALMGFIPCCYLGLVLLQSAYLLME